MTGIPTIMPEGSRVIITQQLGGSFTVMSDRGALFRVDECDADALGHVPVAKDETVTDANLSIEDRIWEQLKKCYDPEIPVNIVDLGLVYNLQLVDDDGDQRAEIKMTLTAPGCGMGPVLAQDVKTRVEEIEGIQEAFVDVVFDPPWNQNMMTEAARLQLGFM